jgi:CHAT domain-containing protein/Tfp pilus assembly protein PilF
VNCSGIRFTLLIIAGLLLGSALAVSDSEVSNPDLVAAIALYRTEGPEAALPDLQRLLGEFKTSRDRLNEANALRYIGECHWRLGNFDTSREYLDRALSVIRDLDDHYAEGKTLNVLGLLEWDLGNFDAAIVAINKANAIALELGDTRLEASTLNNLSLVYDELGDYQTSLEQYRRANELFAQIGNLRGQGDALGNIGGVYLLLGRFQEALDYYQQALAFSRQLRSKPAMTIDHGNIALCFLGLGQVDTALEHFDVALKLAVETGMREEQAYWQRGKANALIRQGKYDLGLENYRAALTTYTETGARVLLLDALHDMGRLHLTLGDTVSAEQYFHRAISQAREMGHEQVITVNLLALGDLQFERENLEEANALFLQANQRATAAGEVNSQAESLLRLALVSRERSKYGLAEKHAMKALSIANETGASSVGAEAWYALAELARQERNLEGAFRKYASAQAAIGNDGDPELRWQIHYGRAQLQVTAGDKRAAITELKLATGIIESVRDRLREERFRAGYVQDKFQVYIDLVRLQLDLGLTQDAFSSAERLRARSFLAQLDRGAPLVRTQKEHQAEMAMRERIRQLQNELVAQQRKLQPERRQLALTAFSSELMQAEREYQAFLDDHGGNVVFGHTVKIPKLTELQAHLGPSDALVEYVLDEDQIIIFIMRSVELKAVTRKLRRTELFARIILVRELTQRPDSDRWLKPAASLSDTLIKPLFEDGLLQGVEHIYLVPYGMLNYLPFALLPLDSDRGELLMERYTLSYLPAAAALKVESLGKDAVSPLLAMAPLTTGLRFAPEEASSITEIFQPGAQLLVGSDATETALKTHAKDYEILHLATHGYFNKKNPLLSGLELEADVANDGRLEVHEILALSLSAQLVTLSACQTGLGSGFFNDFPAGDDFVGLTRAFLLAGSHSVLASLWEVDDRSTVDLMKGFYERLKADGSGIGKAAALALVQREMRSSKEFNHPFYWAPFVLVGQHGKPAKQT